MTDLLQVAALAVVIIVALWDRRRLKRAAKTEARLESAAEQYRLEQMLREKLADAEADKPSGDADTRDRLRDHAAGR